MAARDDDLIAVESVSRHKFAGNGHRRLQNLMLLVNQGGIERWQPFTRLVVPGVIEQYLHDNKLNKFMPK